MDTTQNQGNQPIPAEIRGFLESLLQDANMAEMEDGLKEEMIKELYVRLDSHITATIVDKLPEDQVETFVKMNEEGKSQDEIQQFLMDKIPDTQNVMTQAFMEFREMYLGNVTDAANAPVAES